MHETTAAETGVAAAGAAVPLIHVLAIGDATCREFRDAARWLERQAAVVWQDNVTQAAQDAAALRGCDSQPLRDPLTLIILFCSYPGQIGDADILRLRRQHPIAPVIALLSSWCESDNQWGTCHAATRVYWHQWQPIFESEFQRLRHGMTPRSALPVTMADDERWLAHDEYSHDVGVAGESVAIVASNWETASSLLDMCRAANFGSVWVRDSQVASIRRLRACIYDIPSEVAAESASISQLCHAAGSVPVIAMVGFPRADDLAMLYEIGVAHVVAKPFEVQHVIRLLAKRESACRQ